MAQPFGRATAYQLRAAVPDREGGRHGNLRQAVKRQLESLDPARFPNRDTSVGRKAHWQR
jgi:hypothetical protein